MPTIRGEATPRPHPDLSLRSGRPSPKTGEGKFSPILGEMSVGQRGTDEKLPNKTWGFLIPTKHWHTHGDTTQSKVRVTAFFQPL